MFQFSSEEFRVKVGLAEMLKGGVIMDVTTAEQARIAEDAGASAVMALERVPSDIRKEGGVARMAAISVIEEIMRTVTIPVMAKARIGHFMEARVLESLGVSARLGAAGLKLDRFSIRDRDQLLVRLRFDTLPSPYAHLLMLPQDRTEGILLDALKDAGGEVRWGSTLEALRETPDGVEAIVSSGEGRQTIRARYVVGADGMHSVVRKTAGIGFSGKRSRTGESPPRNTTPWCWAGRNPLDQLDAAPFASPRPSGNTTKAGRSSATLPRP